MKNISNNTDQEGDLKQGYCESCLKAGQEGLLKTAVKRIQLHRNNLNSAEQAPVVQN